MSSSRIIEIPHLVERATSVVLGWRIGRGERGQGLRSPQIASVGRSYRDYLAARFADDPHVLGSVLFREVGDLGFDRSYSTLTRELRTLELRPACKCCRRGGVDVTIEMSAPVRN